jgi:hypothetical protein
MWAADEWNALAHRRDKTLRTPVIESEQVSDGRRLRRAACTRDQQAEASAPGAEASLRVELSARR